MEPQSLNLENRHHKMEEMKTKEEDKSTGLEECLATKGMKESECKATRVTGLMSDVTIKDVQESQLRDPTMCWIIEAKEKSGCRPDWDEGSSRAGTAKVYWSQWDQLGMRDTVLTQHWESKDGQDIKWQVILPFELCETMLEELHRGKGGGNFGINCTLARLKARYYWCGMAGDVRASCHKCDICAKRKSPP